MPRVVSCTTAHWPVNGSSRSRHSASVAVANSSAMMVTASAPCSRSDTWSAKRSSSVSSGRPMTSQNGRQYWPAWRQVSEIQRSSEVRYTLTSGLRAIWSAGGALHGMPMASPSAIAAPIAQRPVPKQRHVDHRRLAGAAHGGRARP